LQLFLPLAAGISLLAGLVVLGGLARDSLREEGGHIIAFADVECEPPEGMSRKKFLEEAQYLADLPDRIKLLDPDINSRIAEGLSVHPWVARVRRVERRPNRGLRVDLVYRVPVLAMAGEERAVDAEGILLPASARRKNLPTLRARVSPPRDGPGHAWGDDTVKGAAAVAGLLLPHLARLKLTACTVEGDSTNLVLRTSGTRILWGRPPGREHPDEARARQKLQRLLDRPDLEGQEHDLRPAAGVLRGALAQPSP
jgi:hypothetical protein